MFLANFERQRWLVDRVRQCAWRWWLIDFNQRLFVRFVLSGATSTLVEIFVILSLIEKLDSLHNWFFHFSPFFWSKAKEKRRRRTFSPVLNFEFPLHSFLPQIDRSESGDLSFPTIFCEVKSLCRKPIERERVSSEVWCCLGETQREREREFL